MIPSEVFLDVYMYRITLNSTCKEFLHKDLLEKIDEKFRFKLDFPHMRRRILKQLSQTELYTISLTAGTKDNVTIVYKQPFIATEDTSQCDNCGFVWDGCTQCTCDQDPFYEFIPV